jgi:hypothetical protein
MCDPAPKSQDLDVPAKILAVPGTPSPQIHKNLAHRYGLVGTCCPSRTKNGGSAARMSSTVTSYSRWTSSSLERVSRRVGFGGFIN